MRLWHLSPSVNSSFKHACGAFHWGYTSDFWSDPSCTFILYVCEQRRLWAFAVRLCDTYHNLMSWIIYWPLIRWGVWGRSCRINDAISCNLSLPWNQSLGQKVGIVVVWKKLLVGCLGVLWPFDTFSCHFSRGQLTYPHCSWESLLDS